MKPLKILISAFLIIPAGAVLLLGPRSQAPADPTLVEVEYWEKWNGEEARQLGEVIEDFNNTVGKEKHIHVRCMTTSQIDKKILIATAAGVPPDIAGLWDYNLAALAALDALTPLETMAAEHGITAAHYKKVYWDTCFFDGHLNALVSTPAVVALHYNKRIFQENAAGLRAAGLSPDRPPGTIAEMDAYCKVLDMQSADGSLKRAGYLPLEPDWFREQLFVWFDGEPWDPVAHKFTLTNPGVLRAYTWLQSYYKRLGSGAINQFHLGAGTFDSPQNPFLIGSIAMEQQGPWLANYINHLKPSMSEVHWPLAEDLAKPLEQRLTNYDWAAAPFPSDIAGKTDVASTQFDSFVIPRGAKHPKEAFEFIAYVNRQDVMEKLCMMHCKNSPLAKVSDDFVNHHPNPYIYIFERLARSENARHLPLIPIYTQFVDEMDAVIQNLALLQDEPLHALTVAQDRLQAKYDQFALRQAKRREGL